MVGKLFLKGIEYGHILYIYPYVHLNSVYTGFIPSENKARSEWEEVGTGSASGEGISGLRVYAPTLAVSPNGTPYVAWTRFSPTYDVLVGRWNGSSWEKENVSNSSANDEWSSLAIAADGTPYIAWTRYDSTSQIYVRRRLTIQVAPRALVFLAEAGSANPSSQDIAVDSSLDPITFTATLSPTVSWLSVSPISGTTPVTFVADATTSGVGIGQYTTQVVITDRGDMEPQIVDVKLIVAEEIYALWLPLALRD